MKCARQVWAAACVFVIAAHAAQDRSLLLQNLFDPDRVEWAPAAAQLQRAAFLKATLRF